MTRGSPMGSSGPVRLPRPGRSRVRPSVPALVMRVVVCMVIRRLLRVWVCASLGRLLLLLLLLFASRELLLALLCLSGSCLRRSLLGRVRVVLVLLALGVARRRRQQNLLGDIGREVGTVREPGSNEALLVLLELQKTGCVSV